MKNWKNKLTSKTFWLSLAGAVVIVLQCFGLKIDLPYVNEIVSAICSVLIILGIMRNDTSPEISVDENGKISADEEQNAQSCDKEQNQE